MPTEQVFEVSGTGYAAQPVASAIGSPKEKIRIEPVEVPVPEKTPAPVEVPVEVPEKEPVG